MIGIPILGYKKGENGEKGVERMAKMNRRQRRENRTLPSCFSRLLFGLLAVHKVDLCIAMNRHILYFPSHASQKHLNFQPVPMENAG